MSEDFTPVRVMVIDDDEHSRAALGMLLESESYAVTLCSGAIEALGRLRAEPQPDLIVLDLVMPEMTGWEFRVEQKRRPAWAGIPVLALSGDHSPQAEAIDATAYMGKPVQERAFLDTVRRIEKDVKQKRELARASELERLVSLGSLIGGIAHEINNPLAFIEGSLDVLRRQLVTSVHPARLAVDSLSVASALRALERTKVGVDRIAEVVRCVSMFASVDPESDGPLNVHDVLEASLQVAENEIRHCALIERDYESLPLTYGNPAKLGQVFLNVILNAVRAIRGAAEGQHLITVKTRSTRGWVAVTISDTAATLDAAAQRALFDPLTSVATGRMGLHFGLAVSREIVEAVGGVIEVHTRASRGTEVCVTLPSCTEAVFEPPVTRRLERRVKDRVSIMVVDDDPLMCEVLAALLASDYDVTAFTSPRAALAVMLEGDIDLILCDVMMPELSGIDVYERLDQERPELARRFIFLTGGAFTERARIFLKRIDRPVITKPFARKKLLDAIQQTLASASRADEPRIESGS